MTKDEFIGKCINNLLRDGFNITLKQKKKVNGYGGFFDYYNKDFSVAMKNECGFEIFVHEYCHYLQWLKDPEGFAKRADNYGTLSQWLKGDNCNRINQVIKEIISIEHECELMAIDLIQRLGFDVDLNKYRKGTNAYLFSYHYVKKYRVWSTTPTYSNSKIIDCMPTRIMDLDYYYETRNIPHAIKIEFDKDYEKYVK